MSLRTGILTLIREDGEEKELRTSGKVFRIGSYLSCDLVLDDPEARSVHCEIQSDSFGRITITNYSKSNPVRINDVPLKGTRPLHTGSVIKVFEKSLKWVNKHCLPRSRVDIDNIQTPKAGHKRTEQAPNSEPSILIRRKQASKRTTIHNLGSSKNLTDDEEEPDAERNENVEDNRQERLTRASMISAAKTFGATPPRSIKRTKNISARKVSNVCDLTKSTLEECKENAPVDPLESKNFVLLKCQSSGVVVTSYSPSATPTNTPKSFARVISNKNTPKSTYGTPRSAVSDLNPDNSLRSNIQTPKTPAETCSMFLIDFTTPDVYKTPLLKRTPLFRSAMKNSSTKAPLKGENHVSSVTPASNKKIRWESPNSNLMSTEDTPSKHNTTNMSSKNSASIRSVTKNSSSRRSNYVTATPVSLTRQRILTTESSKSVKNPPKVTPNLRRKSLNMSGPLKTPKAIFSADRPTSVKFNRFSSAKSQITPNSAHQLATTSYSTEKCEPLKTLGRSLTYILDTPTSSVSEVAAEEPNSKSVVDVQEEENLNDTFTCSDDNDLKSTKNSSQEDLQNITDKNDVVLKVSESESSESEEHSSMDYNGIMEDEKLGSGGSPQMLDSFVENISSSGSNKRQSKILPPSVTHSDSIGSLEKTNSLIEIKECTPTSAKIDFLPISSKTIKRKSMRLSRSIECVEGNSEGETTGNIETNDKFKQLNSANNSICPKRDDFPNLVGMKELLKTPKPRPHVDMKGVKELFNTPTRDDLTDVRGVKELIKSPRPENRQIELKGVKELFNTPARDDLSNLVGVKELMNTPKEGHGIDNAKGLRELFKTPNQETGIDNVKGVRELFYTPKLPTGLNDGKGMKELFKTPKACRSMDEIQGLNELFNTPADTLSLTDGKGDSQQLNNLPENNLLQFKGANALRVTPTTNSAKLSGSRQVIKTPFVSENHNDGLCEIFKSPGSRKVMVLGTPKSIAVEKVSNKSNNLLKTPKEVDVLEDVEDVEEIFKSPVSNLIFSCIDRGENEGLSPEQSFDKLVGKPIVRRTYGRTTVTPRVLPIPIADENETGCAKTDIQEWLDNVECENKSQKSPKLRTNVDSETDISPAVKVNRKPLATSSSIKPTRKMTRNAKRLMEEGDLNEMSGIEQLDDSFLSSAEISEVPLPLGENSVDDGDQPKSNTIESSIFKLNTPQKTDKSNFALKVTPQIRRLRGNLPTPCHERSSRRQVISDPFANLSVQYIDESSINICDSKNSADVVRTREASDKNGKGSTLKVAAANTMLDTSTANSTVDVDAEYLSTSESVPSRKSHKVSHKTTTKSGAVIFISDDESNSRYERNRSVTVRNDQETTQIIAHKTLEFVAMNELSTSSLNYENKTMLDEFSSLPDLAPNQCEESNAHVSKFNENTIEDSLVENAGIIETCQSVSYEEEEENLLNMYDTQLTNKASECRSFEVVYIDSNKTADAWITENNAELRNVEKVVDIHNQSNRRSTRISKNESSVSLAAGSKTTFSESSLVGKQTSPLKCDSVSTIDETTLGRSVLISSLNVSDEFVNFVEKPAVGKHVPGISATPQAAKKAKNLKPRRTLGSAVQSTPIDIAAEKILREFSNFNLNPVVRLPRGKSQLQVKSSKVTASRRTTGNLPLDPCFDLQAEKRKRDLSIDFEHFLGYSTKQNLRGRSLSPEKNRKPAKDQRTMGQKPINDNPLDYNLKTIAHRDLFEDESNTSARNHSSEFDNFDPDKEILINPKRQTFDFNKATNKDSCKFRHSLGDNVSDTNFNVAAEKQRLNLSLDFRNFKEQPSSRRVRGNSETIKLPTLPADVNRRTMGGRPISKTFDLNRELEQNRLEREHAQMDPMFDSLESRRTYSQTPTKACEVQVLPDEPVSVGREVDDKEDDLEVENIPEGGNAPQISKNMPNLASPSNSGKSVCSPSEKVEEPVAAIESTCEGNLKENDLSSEEKCEARSRRAMKKLTAENESNVGDVLFDPKKNEVNNDDVESTKHVRFDERIYYEIIKNDSIDPSVDDGRPATRKRQRKGSTADHGEIEPKTPKLRGKKAKLGKNKVLQTVEGDLRNNVSTEELKTTIHKENPHDENKENDSRSIRRARKIMHDKCNSGDTESTKLKDYVEVVKAPTRATRGKRRNVGSESTTTNKNNESFGEKINILQKVESVAVENQNDIINDESNSENSNSDKQSTITEAASKSRTRRGKKNHPSLDSHQEKDGQQNTAGAATGTKRNANKLPADSLADATPSVQNTESSNEPTSKTSTRGKKGRAAKILTKASNGSENLSGDEKSAELQSESPTLKTGIRKGRVVNVMATNVEVRCSPRINARTRNEKTIAQDEPSSSNENPTLVKSSQQTKEEHEDVDVLKGQKPRARNLRQQKSNVSEIIEPSMETVVPRRTRRLFSTDQTYEKCIEEAMIHEQKPLEDIKETNKSKIRGEPKPRGRNTRLKSLTDAITEPEQNNENSQVKYPDSFPTSAELSPSKIKAKGRAKRKITKEHTNEPSSKTAIIPMDLQGGVVEEIFKTPKEIKPKLRSTRLKSASDTPNNVDSGNIVPAKRTRRFVSTDTLKTPEDTTEINKMPKSRTTRLKSTDIFKESDSPQMKHVTQVEHVNKLKVLQQQECQEAGVEKPIQLRTRRGRKAAVLNVATDTVASSLENRLVNPNDKVEMIEEEKPKRGRKPKVTESAVEKPPEQSTPTKARGRGEKRKVENEIVESEDVPKRTRSRRK